MSQRSSSRTVIGEIQTNKKLIELKTVRLMINYQLHH